MGTATGEILGNDTSFDVHASVLEAFDAGSEVRALAPFIRKQFRQHLALADDRDNVLFGLALALWEIGELDAALRAQVTNLIARGHDLPAWKRLGARAPLLAARQKALLKFAKRIATVNKAPRPRKPAPPPVDTIFAPGACLAFRYPDGRFGGAVAITAAFQRNRGAMSLASTTLKQLGKPSATDFARARLLSFEWEVPFGDARRLAAQNGKIGRISVRGIGYDKAAERSAFLAGCTSFFDVIGQLNTFHHVLLGSSGLGIDPRLLKTPKSFHTQMSQALHHVYRDLIPEVRTKAPTLRTLSRLLPR